MRRKSIPHIRAQVLAASQKALFTAYELTGETNPQLVEMRIKKEAEAAAFKAVADALAGDDVILAIYAKSR